MAVSKAKIYLSKSIKWYQNLSTSINQKLSISMKDIKWLRFFEIFLAWQHCIHTHDHLTMWGRKQSQLESHCWAELPSLGDGPDLLVIPVQLKKFLETSVRIFMQYTLPGIVFLQGFEWEVEEKRKHSNTSKVEIIWYGFSTNLVSHLLLRWWIRNILGSSPKGLVDWDFKTSGYQMFMRPETVSVFLSLSAYIRYQIKRDINRS